MLAARRGQARSGHFGNTADGHAAEWRTCKYAGTAGQLCDGGRAPGHDRAARPMGAARCGAACRASAQHRPVGCGRARQYGNTAGRQIAGTAVRGNGGNNTMDGGAPVVTGPRGPRAARRSAAGRAPACPPGSRDTALCSNAARLAGSAPRVVRHRGSTLLQVRCGARAACAGSVACLRQPTAVRLGGGPPARLARAMRPGTAAAIRQYGGTAALRQYGGA